MVILMSLLVRLIRAVRYRCRFVGVLIRIRLSVLFVSVSFILRWRVCARMRSRRTLSVSVGVLFLRLMNMA